MPFAGYKDFADCVAQNSKKQDPDAYCATIKRDVEEMRHIDFQRIYDEFQNYYKIRGKGDSEYYAWLKALSLDEQNEYGHAYESFRWAKDMLSFLKEDADNKYYSILLGFPIKSMNGNVYKERDLIVAALSLTGKHPSLNHKDAFWFSPDNERNEWGTLTVKGAKYEDGAIEAILQVPKDAICPICDGAKMTELIDNRRIVNVSLEGLCQGGVCDDGSCEGFTFTDPPFTLLTSDILPGIPLARIKPLESIMVEALQAKTRKEHRMKKKTRRIKLRPKIREERDPAKMGQKTPPTRTDIADTSVHKPTASTGMGPSGKDFRGTLKGVSQQTEVAYGTDPAHAKPEGIWQVNIIEPEDVYPKEGSVGTPLHVKPSDQPELISPADPMPEVDSHVGPDTASKPPTHLDMPEGDTSMHPTAPAEVEPEPPHDCAVDHHWSAEDGKCVPDAAALADTGGVKVPLEQEAPSPPCPEGWHEVDNKCVKNATEQDAVMPDIAHGCPTGSHWSAEANKCVPDEASEQEHKCPEGQHWDPASAKCTDGVVNVEQEHECPEGEHWDVEAGKCMADVDVTAERVRRIQAEYKVQGLAKNLEYVEAVWIDKYTKIDDAYQKLRLTHTKMEGVVKELRRSRRTAESKVDALRDKQAQDMQEVKLELEDYKSRYASTARESSKTSSLVEDLQAENTELKNKYSGALRTNLNLSRKLTTANEEYLELAKEREQLKNAITRSRNEAKKILKIKA